MKRSLLSMAFAVVLGVTTYSPAIAQGKKHDPAKPPAKSQDTKKTDSKDQKKDEPKKDSKVEEYEKTIKDLTKITGGSFTLYQRKKEILLELPEDKLNKLFLIQASLNTGVNSQGLQAGDPVGILGVDAFRWQKQDEVLWLMRPNERFRWDKSDPLSVAAARSFPEAILGTYRIEASNPDKKLLLVNVTQLFSGDVFRLNEMVGTALGGPYMLDREKSWPDKVKSFDKNAVVQMHLHFMSARGEVPGGNPLAELFGFSAPDQLEDTRSAPIRVTYNMWWRNSDEYKPRLADPRVGYFTQDFYSVDKFLGDDRTERYIMRFNLKKKDPAAAISEPVKPIMWTIDPSVPLQYRDAVKQGVLRWNKAFEAIGYKNAVQVQDAPKDGDYDHADGRYNVIRWTMSENSPYAVSWFRTDPFTGEILNASITFDANMLAYAVQEHEKIASPVATMSTRKITDVLLRDPNRTVSDDDYLWTSDADLLRKEAEKKMHKYGFGALECQYGSGLAANANFSWNALLATSAAAGGLKISKDEYAKQFISDTICHEAGHCLGLRHNFVASTNLSTKQLDDDSITSEQGIAASVMDYNPVNVMAILKGHGNFYSPTIGPYDIWAVKYGYEAVNATSPSAEKNDLTKVAAMSGQHGLAYESDENADSWDPHVVLFDEGSDPLNYADKMIEASQRVRKYAVETLPRSGESYSKRTDMILKSILQAFSEGRTAARFVGGVNGAKNFRDDTGEHYTLAPVDPKEQRQAMHLVVQHLLSADSFQLPKEVLMNLSMDPNSDMSALWTAPMRQLFSSQQERMLARLMSASTTDRVCENQFKWGQTKGAYTINEHYGLLLGSVFSEVGKNQAITPTRRDLQRFAVNVLMIQAAAPANSVNEDVREITNDSLKRLSARFGEQLTHADKLDDMTKVHIRDTKDTIDKFLNRAYVIGGR